MARVIVYPPVFDIFAPPPADGTWTQEFPIRMVGRDVPGGSAVDVVRVTFQASETATERDAKVTEAAKATAQARGFTVADTLTPQR